MGNMEDQMTSQPVEDIAAQALTLAPYERARLLERLLASFEPKTLAQEKWLVEVASRRETVRAAAVAMVRGDEALQRVRARLS